MDIADDFRRNSVNKRLMTTKNSALSSYFYNAGEAKPIEKPSIVVWAGGVAG